MKKEEKEKEDDDFANTRVASGYADAFLAFISAARIAATLLRRVSASSCACLTVSRAFFFSSLCSTANQM